MEESKNVLRRFFGSRTEEMLVQHVLDEVGKGRDLRDVMEDAYVTNRASDAERHALLDHREIVEAVGRATAQAIKDRIAGR